jgi:hypothetical protein
MPADGDKCESKLGEAVRRARDAVCTASEDGGLAVAVVAVTREGSFVHVALDRAIGGTEDLQQLINSVGKTVTDFVKGARVRSGGSTTVPEPHGSLVCSVCQMAVVSTPSGHGGCEMPITSVAEITDIDKCDHGLRFNPVEAAGLSSSEVRRLFPRLDGRCERCGYEGIAYASAEHFLHYAGDW